MTLRFFAHNHQHKGLPYIQALERGGLKHVRFYADFYLLDHDCGQRPFVAEAAKRGKPVLLYQHAARPPIQWDGICEPALATLGHLVYAPGHQEVMQAYGYPRPTWVTGWPLGPIRPFRKTDRARSITFAPIHPNANGYLPPQYRERNQRAFQALLDLNDVRITVRHIHGLEANGLWMENRKTLRYQRAEPNGRTEEIDSADLVLAAQTYAFLAISRGAPVIMLDEDICPVSGSEPETLREVSSWTRYREIWKYPWNFPEGEMNELIQSAGRQDPTEWKRRFIGEPFRPAAFAGLVKGIVRMKAIEGVM